MEVPTPREKGPGSNCRGGEEEFVLYLQGVIAFLPSVLSGVLTWTSRYRHTADGKN
jgi:hypothetical protein